ncbi:MAG: PKD domain-containing protein [Bacteroidetes bacterium]|nr:PKD domain-containing protein [Bacteroidota bacterium]
MKKLSIIFSILMLLGASAMSQSNCPGNLITNSTFSAGMTGWSQYGTITTAGIFNLQNGCLDTCLMMQATTNSNCGVQQAISLRQDSCYRLCYCVQFPGGTFNTKLTIAAITPGITVTQLLSGSFTPSQAQIIDVLTASFGFPPYTRCPSSFKATGNFTGFVIVNQTIGPYGSDVRVDNICLKPDVCPPSCANVNAYFSYSGSGTTVNFTDLSTFNPGDVLSWMWNFGDPASGASNTSTLQNPTHVFTSTGAFVVCLYLTAMSSIGVTCHDTLCIDLSVFTNGIIENSKGNWKLSPNPANDWLRVDGSSPDDRFILRNALGQVVMDLMLTEKVIQLPQSLPFGVYYVTISNNDATVVQKLVIRK